MGGRNTKEWCREYEQRPHVRAYRKAYRQSEVFKRCQLRLKAEQRVRIRAFLDEYKLSRGCADCGYRQHPAALEFDHIGPKRFEIGGAARTPLAISTIMGEIKQCEVVCANCHRVRTAIRKEAARSA